MYDFPINRLTPSALLAGRFIHRHHGCPTVNFGLLLFSSTSAILAMQSTNTVFVSAEVVLAVSLRNAREQELRGCVQQP